MGNDIVTTLKDFMDELGSFHNFSKLELARAKKSRVSTKNDSNFRQVVKNYCNGLYDGDLDVLVNRVVEFLPE
jgi:hypothetical protein